MEITILIPVLVLSVLVLLALVFLAVTRLLERVYVIKTAIQIMKDPKLTQKDRDYFAKILGIDAREDQRLETKILNTLRQRKSPKE